MKKFATLFAIALSFMIMMTFPAKAQDPCTPTNQIAENITAHSVDLSWENLTGPTWVRYYPTGTQDYQYRFAHENNAVSLHWLLETTEYTWELNTFCDTAWTGYAWPQTFTTIEDTVVCEPTNQMADNITAHSADLSWEGLTGPTWVRYYPTGTQQYKYKFAQQNNAVSLNWLLAETEYTWELNTLCGGQWTGYDWPQTFTTLEDTVVCEPTNQIAENITAHTADLSWEGLTGPTWVRYYPTGTEEYRYKFAQQNNAVSLNWLLAETEYTWELNTLCGGQWTGYDWPQTFTTLEDTVVCEPTNQIAENITAHTADLSWEGLTGPTWVRYYPTGTQEYRYKFAHENNAVSLTWLTAETEYTWELNTFCGGQWTGYDWPQTFTTLEDTVVCEPTNQIAENITAHTADLSWEGLTGPTWVRIYPTGTTEYKYRFANTTNQVSIHCLLENTEYTWEINTLCNGFWTGYDWPATFTTPEDTATTNCEPVNLQATNVTATTADLSWEGIQGPTYICYYVAGTQDYAYKFTTGLMVSLDELTPETGYEWQINNFCQGAWTGYNTTGAFTTLAEGSEIAKTQNGNYIFKISVIKEPAISGLQVYPNPVSDQAVVSFEASSSGTYSLRLMNLLGSLVDEQQHSFAEGLNTVSLDFSGRNNGIYFVILQQGNQMEKLKIVKE